MSSPRPKLLETSTIANKRFELTKKLGEGCFGEVFKGKDTKNGTEVAIKFEEYRQSDTLGFEAEMLESLRRPFPRQGFSEVLWNGREGPYNCLVMELLSRSLEDTVELQGGSFDHRTAAVCAEQAIMRLEYLHSKCIVHRDIKPENFMWGVGNKIHILYMIDFGLSVKYWDKRHLPMGTGQSLTGTARYASIGAHRGYTQSRRDDLEAVGHMLFYLVRGKLPWSGLKAKTDNEKFRKIMEKKEETPIPELCKGHPSEFQEYLEYARNLPFKERPDYHWMQGMFRKLVERTPPNEGSPDDERLPWLVKENVSAADLMPLEHNQVCKQPDELKPTGAGSSKGFFCCCGSSSNVAEPKRASGQQQSVRQSAANPKAMDTE